MTRQSESRAVGRGRPVHGRCGQNLRGCINFDRFCAEISTGGRATLCRHSRVGGNPSKLPQAGCQWRLAWVPTCVHSCPETFNAVVCDAPSSSTASFRRRPEPIRIAASARPEAAQMGPVLRRDDDRDWCRHPSQFRVSRNRSRQNTNKFGYCRPTRLDFSGQPCTCVGMTEWVWHTHRKPQLRAARCARGRQSTHASDRRIAAARHMSAAS